MKTALGFFGAFNPPTMAHLTLARVAAEETGFSQTIFVPSRSDYIRNFQGKDYAYSDETRLRMLRRLAETRPWMGVTDIELCMDRQPRTYITLCQMREQGVQASLLMGTDKLRELEKWRYVEQIAREFGIVCVDRGEDDGERLLREDPYLRSIAPYVRIIRGPEALKDVSSSAVRRRVTEIRRLREEIAAMTPTEIMDLLEEG